MQRNTILTCQNHPKLRWMIIGEDLFYLGEVTPDGTLDNSTLECSCHAADMTLAPEELH